MISILLRPKILGMRNRWRTVDDSGSVWRDAVVLFFAVLVMIGIYQATYHALVEVRQLAHLAYLSPFIPFSIIFMVLFVMLLISSSVAALGTLYLSNDLHLLLAAPITPWEFFKGKFTYIFFCSAWMPIVFISPLLLAYGRIFEANLDFYVVSLIVLIPYFLIPAALAIILATIFTAIVPAQRTKEILVVVVILFLGLVYTVAELLGWGAMHRDDVGEILRILSILSLPNEIWIPSHWVAFTLEEYLEKSGYLAVTEIILLYSLTFALVAFAHMILVLLHGRAYTKACNNKQRVRSSERNTFLERVIKHLPSDRRALVLKEYRVFVREMTQAVQLILLLGVYIIYLYNLKAFRGLDALPDDTRGFWRALLFIINIAMGAFITTAVCTRFVYPSISLEGRSFWILKTSPVSLKKLMDAKFWSWYLPIGLISSIVFSSGSVAVSPQFWMAFVNFLAGWVISFGIVGVAMGLGAGFANFRWEHSSQLAASFGSLVFMLTSTLLIALNMVPVGVVAFMERPATLAEVTASPSWLFVVLACSIIVVLCNIYAKRVAMSTGAESLRRQLED